MQNIPVHILRDCRESLQCSCHLSSAQYLGSQAEQSRVRGPQ